MDFDLACLWTLRARLTGRSPLSNRLCTAMNVSASHAKENDTTELAENRALLHRVLKEKQALLEATTLKDRLDVLTSLVEMAVLETTHEESGRQ